MSPETKPRGTYAAILGTGTDIYIDLDNTTVEGVDEKSIYTQIAHELAHAWRFNFGLVEEGPKLLNGDNFQNKLTQFYKDEVSYLNRVREVEERAATQMTNEVRRQIDTSGIILPIRLKYSNLPIWYVNPFSGFPQKKKDKFNTILIYPNGAKN